MTRARSRGRARGRLLGTLRPADPMTINLTGAQAKWEVRTGFPQLISFSA